MAFDGIVTNSIVSELNASIIGGKINKIYEPTKNDLILGFYANGQNFALHICIHSENCRLHLTTNAKPNPLQAPNFCMLLRKHLINAKILSIHTFDLERVVEIVLEARNELNDKVIKKLIIEIMAGQSNIILTNENNVIIDAIRHISIPGVYREIMPARTYEMPGSNKSSFLDITDFASFLSILSTFVTNRTRIF
jgi:predicted ribosome quality control (RQC) complex YloA/Tae2 family protein